LRACCHRADFDKAKSDRCQSRKGNAVFVEARSKTNRIRKSNAENGARFIGRPQAAERGKRGIELRCAP